MGHGQPSMCSSSKVHLRKRILCGLAPKFWFCQNQLHLTLLQYIPLPAPIIPVSLISHFAFKLSHLHGLRFCIIILPSQMFLKHPLSLKMLVSTTTLPPYLDMALSPVLVTLWFWVRWIIRTKVHYFLWRHVPLVKIWDYKMVILYIIIVVDKQRLLSFCGLSCCLCCLGFQCFAVFKFFDEPFGKWQVRDIDPFVFIRWIPIH